MNDAQDGRDDVRAVHDHHYEVSIVPNEHGGYYAQVPDLPTIFTGGETPEEAMANAREAIALMLEELAERGMPAPEPLARFSGRFNVRVPRELHRELVRQAARQGVSLNAMVVSLLSRATAGESAAARTGKMRHVAL